MGETMRTTVYLDVADYRRLKALARLEGRSTAALVREAVTQYARQHSVSRAPRSLGRGRSGSGDIAERAEELLSGIGGDG